MSVSKFSCIFPCAFEYSSDPRVVLRPNNNWIASEVICNGSHSGRNPHYAREKHDCDCRGNSENAHDSYHNSIELAHWHYDQSRNCQI